MFENFNQLYCPHCNAATGRSIDKFPKRCNVCNGSIGYYQRGTRKPFFDFIKSYYFPRLSEFPTVVKDILVIALFVLAFIYIIYLKWS